MLSNERRLQHVDHAHKVRDVTTGQIMRGITPHNNGLADGKPSKLELMRADYQKKLLKEKEEKMIQLYEDNQKKVMARMSKVGNTQSRATSVGDGKSVWEYINQRRRVESNRVHSTDSQYKQKKQSSAHKEWSGKPESGSTFKTTKASAGRDRSQPLAPITLGADASEVASTGKSGIPQRLAAATMGRGDGNPFPGRPRLVKHTPLPPTSNHNVDNKNNGSLSDTKTTQPPPPGHKLVPRRSPHIPHQQRSATSRNPPNDPKSESLQSRGQEQLTDFQKWQEEQNQTRDERLKRLNNAKAVNDARKLSDDDPVKNEERFIDNNGVNEEGSGVSETINEEDEVNAKEKELMEKIAQRQRELDVIREDREEEEKLKMEKQKKKEATERMRQKVLDEERKKEEAKRLKQEENEDRIEREREDKRRKEEGKKRKEDEKRMKEEEKRRQQEEKRHFANQKARGRISAQDSDELSTKSEGGRDSRPVFNEDSTHSSVKPSASIPKISGDPHPSKSKMDSSDPDERRLSLTDSYVYEQAAASYDTQAFVGDLAKCKLCGRSFLPERLKKHQDACAKANKPRKEFDSAKKRVEGTELAKYAGKARRPEPPKKNSNWRAKHEEFIQSLRYAKKVTKCEKEGGDLRKLTPPPISENPEYVPCPHCGRTFNEGAAERHIPRCQSLKTRPPPMNTRRK